MTDRRVLFLDGNAMTCYVWRNGAVDTEARFNNEPVGIESFEGYLRDHRGSLCYLLADLGDEGFQLETIPHVQGSDRTALLNRRLGQYFYGTPLSAALSLGRLPGGRRDERILFAALTRPDAIAPWLDAIVRSQAALVGLFSVPLALAADAKTWIGNDPNVLLITVSPAGLRQTYFEGGQMHFSRLSPLTSPSPDEMASVCAREAAKTYQYLISQRQIKRGTRIDAIILADPEFSASLQRHCPDTPEVGFARTDLPALAKTLGLKTGLSGSHIIPLLAHRLLLKTPGQQFAAAAHRRFYRLWQASFGLRSAALAILFACLLLAGRFGIQWYELTQGSTQLRDQASVDNRRYQGILDSLPKIALTPADLRTAIAGFDQLAVRANGFDATLRHLSRALDATPAVELRSLEWMLARSFEAKAASQSAGNAPSAMASPPGVAGGQPQGGWLILDVEGQLPAAMSADQRAMIELLDKFAAGLRQDGYQATLTKRPVDVESGKSFKSTGEDVPSGPPQFSLRLGRSLPP